MLDSSQLRTLRLGKPDWFPSSCGHQEESQRSFWCVRIWNRSSSRAERASSSWLCRRLVLRKWGTPESTGLKPDFRCNCTHKWEVNNHFSDRRTHTHTLINNYMLLRFSFGLPKSSAGWRKRPYLGWTECHVCGCANVRWPSAAKTS